MTTHQRPLSYTAPIWVTSAISASQYSARKRSTASCGALSAALKLRQLDLPPEACLVIEDSSIGLRAARAANLPTVITASTCTVHENFAGALCVVSDLGEPDKPARHIDGLPLEGHCVDLAQLRTWHRQSSVN